MRMDNRLRTHRKSFNRYMVECELKETFNTIIDVACFNRYMVECE